MENNRNNLGGNTKYGENTINKSVKVDKETKISIMICGLMVGLGIFRIMMNGNPNIYDVLNTINSNVFSALTSITICKLYKYVNSDNKHNEEVSGLQRKNIESTILITIGYLIIAVVDATAANKLSTIVYFIVTIIYVYCYINVFSIRRVDK